MRPTDIARIHINSIELGKEFTLRDIRDPIDNPGNLVSALLTLLQKNGCIKIANKVHKGRAYYVRLKEVEIFVSSGRKPGAIPKPLKRKMPIDVFCFGRTPLNPYR